MQRVTDTVDRGTAWEYHEYMNNTLKAGLAVIVAALSLTACSAPIDTTYTGDATIENTMISKNSCAITITTEDGTQKSLIAPSAFDCYAVAKGISVKVINGKVQ